MPAADREDLCRAAQSIYTLSTDESSPIPVESGVEAGDPVAGAVQSIRIQMSTEGVGLHERTT